LFQGETCPEMFSLYIPTPGPSILTTLFMDVIWPYKLMGYILSQMFIGMAYYDVRNKNSLIHTPIFRLKLWNKKCDMSLVEYIINEVHDNITLP
jgi:hypothetical protein